MSDSSQGPGWWQASDGKWYPPEQAPGTAPPPTPGAVPAQTRIDVGESVTYGWEAFKKYPGPLILAFVIVWIGGGIVYVLAYAVGRSNAFLGFLLEIAGFVVAAILAKGLLRICLDVTQGQAPDTSKLFQTEELGPYILASILVAILVSIGLVLCIIPGLFAAVALEFTLYRVIDLDQSPTDAMSASWEQVKPHFWPLVGLLIVLWVINLIGAILCGLGLLVTAPLSAVAVAHAYRTSAGQAVAPL